MTIFQIAVKGRVGPILRTRAKTRVYGAEMYQLPVPFEISFVFDVMGPMAALPETFFATFDLFQCAVSRHWHCAGKP